MKKIVRGFGLVIILLLGTLAYFLSGRADVNQNIASSTQEELHNDNDVDYTDPEDEEEVVEEEGEKEWDYSNAIKDQLLKVKAHSLHQRLNISVKIPNTVKKYFQDDQIDLDRFTKQDCSKKLNQLYKQNANQDHSSLSAPAPIAKIIHQSWKNDVLPKVS
ncbi:hypothetical protein BC833DRAFT_345584 [Globomyces pollinis-pini]|nr:hypothetical protein BC833DRAFT_345584 [Globomyces pollinis-pini]